MDHGDHGSWFMVPGGRGFDDGTRQRPAQLGMHQTLSLPTTAASVQRAASILIRGWRGERGGVEGCYAANNLAGVQALRDWGSNLTTSLQSEERKETTRNRPRHFSAHAHADAYSPPTPPPLCRWALLHCCKSLPESLPFCPLPIHARRFREDPAPAQACCVLYLKALLLGSGSKAG
jgi:hypothetical protein